MRQLHKIKMRIATATGASLFLLALPALAHAQNLRTLIVQFKDLLRFFVIPTLFVLATVIFLWGVIQFLTAAGNEEQLKQGKKFMTWGIIGLVVMLSVWGLVRAVVQSFLLPDSGIPCGPGDILCP